jgi:glycosyltransferase involved in cell wall biosynthesis
MRVLVLSNFYPPHSIGGYEQHCRDVMDGLRARGYEVEVLTSTHGVGRCVREGHVDRRLPARWDPAYCAPSRRGLLAEERDANQALRQAMARFQPEAVSVWNMLGIPYSLVGTAQRSGRPVVLHIADNWPLRRDDPWLRVWSGAGRPWARLVKAAARPLVDRLVPTHIRFRERGVHWAFISKFLKQQHLSHGLAPDDAPVIYAGIPVERFQGRDADGARSALPLRLLFAGSITPAKGVDVAVRALGHLVARGCRDVTLSVLGYCPDRDFVDSLKRLAGEGGFADRVHFRGPVGREEMPAVYAAHDVLLFTSVAQEGFPLTILEAMASGLAVVSSVTGGHGEILEDGRNALTYPAGDAGELAGRIRILLDQPALARRLAEAGRTMVRREHSLERMVERYDRLFRDLMGASRWEEPAA